MSPYENIIDDTYANDLIDANALISSYMDNDDDFQITNIAIANDDFAILLNDSDSHDVDACNVPF